MTPELLRREAEGGTGGTRPPLLFLHGAYCGAWVWDRFLRFFSGHGFDCLALSLRAHGNSPGRDDLHSLGLEEYSADLEWALAACPRPPVLVAHSMGGWLALKALERHALPGLVLLAPVPPSGLVRPLMHILVHAPDLFWQFNLMESLGPQAASPASLHRAMFSPETPLESVMPYFPLLSSESMRSVVQVLWTAPRPRRPPQPPPALVLGGADDRLVPVSAMREAAAHISAEIEILPHLPHAMMLDTTWRTAAERILGWLER